MNLHDFFRTIITTPEGHFCLAFRGTNGWTEEWHQWPGDLDRIVDRAESLRDTNDVYFSSYLFKTTSSTKDNVLPSRTFQADLDNADVSSVPVLPTVLVRTSPNRHQAYWVLEELAGAEGVEGWIDAHEMISRRLTYAIPLCDRSGWPAGRKVRVPDTLNHKYLDGVKPVEIVGESMRKYVAAQFELLPDVPRAASEPYESGFLDAPASGAAEPALGPNELLLRFKDKIGKSYIQYNIRQSDRSVALWALVCALFRAGASRDEVFWIARKSANNKFADLHHNADRELAKDVLRAEQVVRSETLDPRAIIAQARRNSGPVNERRQIMLDTVLVSMRDQGDFVHTYGGSVFYVRRDSGRPIAISKHSEYFDMLLDLQYGLNSVEVDSRFVAAGVYTYANSIPQNGRLGALAHYDNRGHFMLLHTGRKEVLQISKDGISKITDGSYGIVFPWDPGIEPFSPTPPPADFDWADFLFSHPLGPTSGAADALSNVVSCSRDEALALLKIWMLFLLFRELSAARPILAMVGQPGSGKTVLFKKLYALLYGRNRGIASITNPDDFDHGVANDPFYALDNVDTWERWLPDRLALSAAVSDIRKRKLYTDVDIVTVRRQAMVGISAHNPKFGREDVADRMLIFTFKRLENFIAEEEIIGAVHARRNDIWGGIIRDVQAVLRTPPVRSDEAPQFRIEDFAKVGLWIARALNCEAQFVAGLERVKTGQRNFTLEEESLLTTAIRRLVDKDTAKLATMHRGPNGELIPNGTTAPEEWRSPGQLWGLLESESDDIISFIKAYKNSVNLHKKLWSMQESLKGEFDISWQQDARRAGKLWRIRRRENAQ